MLPTSWRLVLVFGQDSEFPSSPFDFDVCPCQHCWCGNCGQKRNPVTVFQRILSAEKPNVCSKGLSEDDSAREIDPFSVFLNGERGDIRSQNVQIQSIIRTVQSEDRPVPVEVIPADLQEYEADEPYESEQLDISVITGDVSDDDSDSNPDLEFLVEVKSDLDTDGEDLASHSPIQADVLREKMISDPAQEDRRGDINDIMESQESECSSGDGANAEDCFLSSEDQELIETSSTISAFDEHFLNLIQQSSNASTSRNHSCSESYLDAFIADINGGLDETDDCVQDGRQLSEIQVVSSDEAQVPISSSSAIITCDASTQTECKESENSQHQAWGGEAGSEVSEVEYSVNGSSLTISTSAEEVTEDLNPIAENVESILAEGEGEAHPRNLTQHVSHSTKSLSKKDQRNVICTECFKCFKEKEALNRHLKSSRFCSIKWHPMYECYQCSDYASKSLTDMRRHRRIHSVEQPRTRESRLRQRSKAPISRNLEVNKQARSSKTSYMCDQCPKFFTGLASLNGHKRAHSAKKKIEQ